MTRSGTATRIAALLDASGSSDHQVAHDLGIHPSLISRYRSGNRRPSKRHTDLLCTYFDCTPAELLGPVDTIEDASWSPLGTDVDADDWID